MKLEFRILAILLTPIALLSLVSAGPRPPATAPGDPPADTTASATATGAPIPAAAADRVLEVAVADELLGHSGALTTLIAQPGGLVPLQLRWTDEPAGAVRYRWVPVLGTPGAGAAGILGPGDTAPAPPVPGVYELEVRDDLGRRQFGDALRVVVTVPFDSKRNGYIGPYHMGTWPTEGKGRADAYAPPAGFIEVTEENQTLQLSQNFQVRQFLTHDQGSVWPKYVAIDPRLVDKLELVLLELRAMGIRADRMVVMSGFRTPQYNHHHLNNPRTSLSRHQFGDAADVWVDNEGDWHMSDLNGDGRRDVEDARVMLRAVERVERRYPELVGGAGLYRANRARGPFIHIDVRGTRARW
jgi:uncharacterized protein YcbK (DUF882 family)